MPVRSRHLRLGAIVALILLLQVFAWQRQALALVISTTTSSLDQTYYEGPHTTPRASVYDSNRADASVTVQVTSTTDPQGFSLTLPRIGGEYSASFQFGKTTAASTQTIGVSDGDTVTTTYNDPVGPSGAPVTVTATAHWYDRAQQPDAKYIQLDNRTPAAAKITGGTSAVDGTATVNVYTGADSTTPVATATPYPDGSFTLTFDNSQGSNTVYLQAVEPDTNHSLTTRIDAASLTTADPDPAKIVYDAAAGTLNGLAGAVGANNLVHVSYPVSAPNIWWRTIADETGAFRFDLSGNPTSVLVQAQSAGPYGEDFVSPGVVVLDAGDQTAPNPPATLNATSVGNQVTLDWTPATASDLAGYNVYRATFATMGNPQKLNSSLLPKATTSYQDTVPAPGTYFYFVRAVDTSNNEGGSATKSLQTTAAFTVSLPVNKLGVGYAMPATIAVTGSGADFTANAPTVRILNGLTAVAAGANVQVQSATGFTFDLSTALDRGAYTVEVTSGGQVATAGLTVTGWPVCGNGRTTQCITTFNVGGVSKLTDPTLTLEVWQADLLQIQVKNGSDYDLAGLAGTPIEIGLNVGAFDPISLAATGDISAFTITQAPGSNTVSFVATPKPSSWLTTGCGIGSCGDQTTQADKAYSAMLIASVSQMDPPPGLPAEQLADFDNFRTNSRGTYIGTNAQTFSSPYMAGDAFTFDVAAPHLKPDGSPNTGFFTAFLPDALLRNYWGLTDPAAAQMVTQRTDGLVVSTVTPTVTPVAGGLQLSLASFGYSSPSFSIKPAPPAKPTLYRLTADYPLPPGVDMALFAGNLQVSAGGLFSQLRHLGAVRSGGAGALHVHGGR